jgi:DNA-binding transcriptional LysR family regulator
MPPAAVRSRPSLDEGHLRLLRIFRAVAEAGGLTAAEARLRMERSTISRHVQALERLLGGTLCYRGPTGFELTELGRVALQVAITTADTLDMVRDRLDRARDAMEGELQLGIADTCASNPRCRIPTAIAAFRAEAPAARLAVTVAPSEELREGLLRRRLHLAVARIVPETDSLRQVSLFSEDFRLYVGLPDGGEPPAVEELAARGYGLVARENDPRTIGLTRHLGLDRRATARGVQAVAMMLAGGGCVGHLPTHLVEALAPHHRFAEVRGAKAVGYSMGFGMITAGQHRPSRAGELFAALLLQAHGG